MFFPSLVGVGRLPTPYDARTLLVWTRAGSFLQGRPGTGPIPSIDPAGHLWLLRTDRKNRDDVSNDTSILERYRTDGPLERQLVFAPGVKVSDFVVHPSGEITAMALQPDGDPERNGGALANGM